MKYWMQKCTGLLIILFLLGVVAYQIVFLVMTIGVDFFSAHTETVNNISYALNAVNSLLVGILICVEINHLEEFNIDKFAVITLILFSFPRLIFWDNLLLAMPVLSCVVVIVILIAIRPKLMRTDLRWAFIGIVVGAVALILVIALCDLFQLKLWTTPHILQNSLVITTIIHIQQELSYTSLPEEILFRGFIWGYLRNEGWGENKIIWTQGILFWLIHFGKLVTPFTFFVSIPILTIISSQLTKRSKQVFPAILSHTIINSVGAILYMAAF